MDLTLATINNNLIKNRDFEVKENTLTGRKENSKLQKKLDNYYSNRNRIYHSKISTLPGGIKTNNNDNYKTSYNREFNENEIPDNISVSSKITNTTFVKKL